MQVSRFQGAIQVSVSSTSNSSEHQFHEQLKWAFWRAIQVSRHFEEQFTIISGEQYNVYSVVLSHHVELYNLNFSELYPIYHMAIKHAWLIHISQDWWISYVSHTKLSFKSVHCGVSVVSVASWLSILRQSYRWLYQIGLGYSRFTCQSSCAWLWLDSWGCSQYSITVRGSNTGS